MKWFHSIGFAGALAASALSFSPAGAQRAGNWKIGVAQGYAEYSVENGPGNSFMISCDIGASMEGESKKTSIFIQIIGKDPPPNSNIDVFADGERFQLYATPRGSVETDCHSCSSNFVGLWSRIRKSKTLIVSLRDGRSSTFNIAGAAKVLPAKHCATGFES